jgi:hypothetical protein
VVFIARTLIGGAGSVISIIREEVRGLGHTHDRR